jgi:hypothetical protein
MTVVSKLVPGPSAGGDQYDWDEADAAVTAEGPHRLVKISVTADEKAVAALPGDVGQVRTALSRLLMYPLDAAYIDISRMRQLLHDDGVETTAAICKLDETHGAE